MAAPLEDAANIDATGKSTRRTHGVIMLVVAAATYIGLIIPPNIDRRWLIASAAPCVGGIFAIMQSSQVRRHAARIAATPAFMHLRQSC